MPTFAGMKWVRSIAFLMLLAAFAACGDNSATVETQNFASLQTRQLQAIDSLMWQQPDSALAQIIDYMDCTDGACTVSTAHYAHLLLAELLYKNDYEQTNRAELLRAVAYYDSLCAENDDIAFLDARAHYIRVWDFTSATVWWRPAPNT